MTLTDYSKNPPVIHISDITKQESLGLLVPGKVTGKGDTASHEYDLFQLQEFTLKLMSLTHISYDSRTYHESDKNELEDFTEEQKKFLYPFAFMLACLQGNAFPQIIEQYIPGAYRIITANGWKLDKLRNLCEGN